MPRASKAIDRRGMGPMDHPLDAGGDIGVHVCTYPHLHQDTEPDDVLEVRCIDTMQRTSSYSEFHGQALWRQRLRTGASSTTGLSHARTA